MAYLRFHYGPWQPQLPPINNWVLWDNTAPVKSEGADAIAVLVFGLVGSERNKIFNELIKEDAWGPRTIIGLGNISYYLSNRIFSIYTGYPNRREGKGRKDITENWRNFGPEGRIASEIYLGRNEFHQSALDDT